MENCEKLGKGFYERVQNPLWLDPILDVVFKFLPKSSLAHCRLVCRQWRDVSERHFVAKNRQSPSTVDLSDSTSILSFLSTFVQRNGTLDMTTDPDRSPWSRYRMDFFQVSPFQRQLFMNICGDSIRWISISPRICMDIIKLLDTFLRSTPRLESLDFSCIVINQPMIEYASLNPGNQKIPDFFQWFDTLKNSEHSFFPHLRRLSLKIYIEENSLDDTTRFFSALFQLMPHLEDLRVSDLEVGNSWNEDRVIPAIIQALQLETQVEVQTSHKVSPNFLGQLVSLQLPYLDTSDIHHLHQFHLYHALRLENLWLASFRDALDWQTLLAFLQGQAETLRKLYLSPYTAGLFLHFPLNFTLDRVSTLEFIRWGDTPKELFVFVPDILIHFPNLTNLVIRPTKSFSTDKSVYCVLPSSEKTELTEVLKLRSASLTSRRVLCDKLSTLNFYGSFERDDPQILDRLIKICPNLLDLELNFPYTGGRSVMRRVFDQWRKLRRLVLHFCGWRQQVRMDSFFTGINYEESRSSTTRSILKNFQGRDWYIIHKEKEEPLKIFPSISFLQDLKILEINIGDPFDLSKALCRTEPDSYFLSDETVLADLMQMPQLRELIINQSSISPSCLHTLSKTLTLEKCRVCDKAGKIMQLKGSEYDEAVDKDDFDKGSRPPAVRGSAKLCDRRRPWLHEHQALNLFFGPDSCCPIV